MLAAQIEPTDDALVGLSVRARDLYEPLAPALRETTGIDIGFWRAGIAAVAFDDAAADRLKEDVARQRQAGLRCDWLEADEVRERWPAAAAAGRARAGADGGHRLARGDAGGDSLSRSRLRARPRRRRRARHHDGARRLRLPRHQRGTRPNLPGSRPPPPGVAQSRGAAH